MANTKITSAVIADNAVGIDQLNVSDGTNGQALVTDGSGTLSFSTIQGYTDSDVETYLNTSDIYTDPTNNRLGIGQSNPQELLHIYGTDPVIRVSDDGTTGFPSLQLLQQNITTEGTELLYDSSTGNTHLNTSYATGDIRFGTATGTLGSTSNVRMTIDHTGKVGIGTTDPQQLLHINAESPNILLSGTSYPALKFSGTDYTTDAEIYYGVSANDLNINNYNDGYIRFLNNNDEALRIIKDSGDSAGLIQFTPYNVGAPTVSDHTVGTRIDYYAGANNDYFYATGVSGNTLWNISDGVHQWYTTVGSSAVQALRVTSEGLTIPTAASDGTGTGTNSGLQAGQIYYNTTDNNFKGYNGSSWFDITSSDLTSISTLELWADVTAGISSTTVSDLSGNNRTATLSSTTSKGTLAGNTYFLVDSTSDSIVYANGVIPDYTPAVTYFFIMTNRKSLSNYGSYITSTSGLYNYQIIRHQSTVAAQNYNFYFRNVTNNTFSNPTAVPPINATINEAVCMIFSWRPQATGTVDIYKYENGTETQDTYNTQVGNSEHRWNSNGYDVYIGTSSWAQEYMDAGFFAWGILSDEASSIDRQIIYNYYKAKGLLT